MCVSDLSKEILITVVKIRGFFKKLILDAGMTGKAFRQSKDLEALRHREDFGTAGRQTDSRGHAGKHDQEGRCTTLQMGLGTRGQAKPSFPLSEGVSS